MSTTDNGKRKIGVFDIRFVIGGLIGLYGVILTLLGVFNASDDELARGDGVNINLWAGLAMVVFALVMGAWAYLRPVIVPDDIPAKSD
ncbi:MAG: hypothetical protein JWQ70_120 [Aeromicrobium sp.]|jgi:membrane-bound ClpP family serine protease|nr:hypothetical protein [Aeromicrobium sp.]